VFHLKLFGGVSLTGPSGPLEGRVSQRRPLALLSLLAASDDGRLSRDKLVACLWPEADSKRARQFLSVNLHVVRKALGKESVLSVGDDLQLNPEVVTTDVREFERALEERELERAVELFAGTFMDGFHVGKAPGFERWVDGERARFGRRYGSALEMLAERAETEGEWRRAVELWSRLAAHDRFSSRIAARLMRALDEAGDRPAALRYARQHALLIREELGVEPDPEVVALAERLENGEAARRRAEEAPGAPIPKEGEVEPPLATEPAVGDLGSDSTTPPSREASEGAVPSRRPKPSGARPGTRPIRPGMWAVGGLVVATALVATVALGFLGRGTAPGPPGADASAAADSRVLVAPLENETGDPSLDPVGRMAADWIARGLAETALLRVMTPITALKISEIAEAEAASGTREDRLREVARQAGAGMVVWGSLYRQGDSLLLSSQIVRAPDGELLSALEPVATSPERPLEGVERLRQRITATLATLVDGRLERWARHASHPPSYDAYGEFVAGLQLHTSGGNVEEAYRRYLRAAQFDSTFTLPLLWALWVPPGIQNADSLLNVLEERRAGMPPMDRALLDYHLATFHWRSYRSLENVKRGYEAALRLVELAPDSEFLYKAAPEALWLGRPEEAVRLLERADPDHGWLRNQWARYWILLARSYKQLGEPEEALHALQRMRERDPTDPRDLYWEAWILADLGLGEEALRAARRARDRHPNDDNLLYLEARTLADLGLGEEALGLVDEVFAEGHEEGRVDWGWAVANALGWHGIPAAEDVMARTLALLEGVEMEELTSNDLGAATDLLGRMGRYEEAETFLEELERRGVGWTPQNRTRAALLAAGRGDEERALEISRELAAYEAPPSTVNVGRQIARAGRAAIAAHTGRYAEARRLLENYVATVALRPGWAREIAWFEPLWHEPWYREMAGE